MGPFECITNVSSKMCKNAIPKTNVENYPHTCSVLNTSIFAASHLARTYVRTAVQRQNCGSARYCPDSSCVSATPFCKFLQVVILTPFAISIENASNPLRYISPPRMKLSTISRYFAARLLLCAVDQCSDWWRRGRRRKLEGCVMDAFM